MQIPIHSGLFTILLILMNLNFVSAKKTRLISGPVPGHITPHTAKFLVIVKGAQQVTLRLFNDTENYTDTQKTADKIHWKDYYPVQFSFGQLSPGTTYRVSVTVDEQTYPADVTITTPRDTPVRDFTFMTGSCAFSPPAGLRWMYPGHDRLIFNVMTEIPADFMLWTGDFLYYINRDFKSPEGMIYTNIEKRRIPQLNRFLKSRPQYAIWDDHDYGPNDSDGSFELKSLSLEIYKEFWPAPYFGTDTTPGIFSHFSWYDCDFFLTDGRYHRTPPGSDNAAMFGDGQLDWLEYQLLHSKATFKFIVSGTQVLNEIASNESFHYYPEEKNRLLNFIYNHRIEGVVFLTGDRHHSELLKKEIPGMYPLYDFTCSPVTSPVRPTKRTSEKNNPLRVEGSLITRHNFSTLTISGPADDRKCHIKVYNQTGRVIWEYTIAHSELRFNTVAHPIDNKQN